jgi:hypothetical protein
MATAQNIIDKARVYLQDLPLEGETDGVRYLNAELLGYIDDGVKLAFGLRPDLFLGSFVTGPTPVTALGTTIPLPDVYLEALGYYVAGRGELRDDEFAVDGRAVMFIKSWESKLLKGA